MTKSTTGWTLRAIIAATTRGSWIDDYDHKRIVAHGRVVAEGVRQDPDRTYMVEVRHTLPMLLDVLDAAERVVGSVEHLGLGDGYVAQLIRDYRAARNKLDGVI